MMTRSLKLASVFFIVLLLQGCGFFSTNEPEALLARVNDHYLTVEDLEDVLKNATYTDSASFVQNYINEWATSQLLLDGALRNLPAIEQDKFEQLVSGYRTDLYTKYYKDALITKQLDSSVTFTEASRFYDENKKNFILNESLLQFKFIQLDANYKNINELKKNFTSDEAKDKHLIDSLKFQYKSFYLNDSTWVKQRSIVEQIAPITQENANKLLLKKSNLIQLRDSLGLYLITVKNTLERNDTAPLEYVRPTIDQIIKNKRKLTLIKRLEKEIKDDAIKNNQFEIYN